MGSGFTPCLNFGGIYRNLDGQDMKVLCAKTKDPCADQDADRVDDHGPRVFYTTDCGGGGGARGEQGGGEVWTTVTEQE